MLLSQLKQDCLLQGQAQLDQRWGGGLFDYSVKPGQELSRLRLSLVRLVTRSIKARFGQVGDQVGQGQGQELDNISFPSC